MKDAETLKPETLKSDGPGSATVPVASAGVPPGDPSSDPIQEEQKWELKFWHVLLFFCGIVILLWLYQAKLLNFNGALRQ